MGFLKEFMGIWGILGGFLRFWGILGGISEDFLENVGDFCGFLWGFFGYLGGLCGFLRIWGGFGGDFGANSPIFGSFSPPLKTAAMNPGSRLAAVDSAPPLSSYSASHWCSAPRPTQAPPTSRKWAGLAGRPSPYAHFRPRNGPTSWGRSFAAGGGASSGVT